MNRFARAKSKAMQDSWAAQLERHDAIRTLVRGGVSPALISRAFGLSEGRIRRIGDIGK